MRKFRYLKPLSIFTGLLFIQTTLQAAAPISHLEVQDDVVIFATSEEKAASALDCLSTDYKDYWAVSLETEQGRYAYGMLMSAMTTGMSLEVEGAVDCEGTNNIERAAKVRLVKD